MPEVSQSRFLVNAGWDDVPHLSEATKRELAASTPPHLLDARTKGVPGLGAGAIYPVPLDDITVAPFQIPAYWPRLYGMDVGWRRTAVLWAAIDRETDVVYCYTEHYRGQAEPSIHAAAIRARGEWIPGLIDPSARGRNPKDGDELWQMYIDLGLNLSKATNAVEAGIYEVWQRLSTGRLKFFGTLQKLFAEYRLYRRDQNGKVVKDFDHLMDALRYLIMSLEVAKVQPANLTGPQFNGTRVADTRSGY